MEFKGCPTCGLIKSISEFRKDKSKKDGLRSQCKECNRTYDKKYYQTHKAEALAQDKKYRQAHKAEKAAYDRAYCQAHKAGRAAYHRVWGQTDIGRAKRKEIKNKRKALKVGVIFENFNPVDIFERDGYICQHCGRKTRPDFKNPNHPLYPNLDHIIPLSKGGAHTKQNTQCLCRQCNMEKSNTGTGDQLRLFG